MYQDAKKLLAEKGYASISELIRDVLRKEIYSNKLTVNGFTEEFENEILKATAEPDDGKVWETEEDIDRYFDALDKRLEKKRHAKD